MRGAIVLLSMACCRGVATPGTPELELYGAEVWTYSTRLEGRAPRTPSRCEFLIDGVAQPASIEGSSFHATLAIQPEHTHQVSARCTEAQRTLSSPTVALEGKASAAPTARARVEGTQLDATASTPNPATQAPLIEFTWLRDGKPHATGPHAPLADGAYELHVRDARGRNDVARLLVAQGRAVEHASWMAGGTVYGVIPPLYGQLAGVTAQLDVLRELGVRALWLSPVFRTIPGDFGYAVTDYQHVREDYGGDAALDALLREAHARGLRVLLDMVINHSSAEHRYFREAQALGPRSHYFGFYDRDASGQPTHYFDWTHLPNFDYQNPEVVAWALAFSRQWIARGVDGYRVDAAWGVRQRSPAFYAAWIAELRRVRPDAFLLAEAPARDPYYREHGFDSAYDWTEDLGRAAWEHVFDGPGIAERLADAVAKSPSSFHFLNNNDTGQRFLTRHGLELTRVATAALLTLPGVPCVYAMDELGAAYQPYDEAPPSEFRPELRPLHRELIALRRDTPAFQGDAYSLLLARGELLVFARGEGAARKVVALNFGAQPVRVEGTAHTLAPFSWRID